jgi:hypothetical protein
MNRIISKERQKQLAKTVRANLSQYSREGQLARQAAKQMVYETVSGDRAKPQDKLKP